MNRQKWIPLAVLAAAAVLLGLALYLLNNAPEEEETDTTIPLSALEADAADSIRWYTAEGLDMALVKQDEVWLLADDAKMTLDQSKVATLVENLAGLRAVRELENTDEEDSFGFDAPTMEFSLTAGEESFTVTVGAQNSVTGDYYARVEGSSAVYTVASSSLTPLCKSTEDLYGAVDITDIEAEDIAEMTVETGGETLRFLQGEDGWTLADDEDYALDQTKVNLMANTLCAMTSTWTITAPVEASVYGLDTPEAAATLTAVDGSSVTVYFGTLSEDGESCYISVDGAQDLVYEVLASHRSAFVYTKAALAAEEDEDAEETAETDETEAEESAGSEEQATPETAQ